MKVRFLPGAHRLLERMNTRRIDRLNATLHTLLSQAIRETVSLGPGVIVTVTRVALTPDLRTADVLVSIFPTTARERTFSHLIARVSTITAPIFRSLPIRVKPHIHFVLDTTAERADDVEHLLSQWHKEAVEPL